MSNKSRTFDMSANVNVQACLPFTPTASRPALPRSIALANAVCNCFTAKMPELEAQHLSQSWRHTCLQKSSTAAWIHPSPCSWQATRRRLRTRTEPTNMATWPWHTRGDAGEPCCGTRATHSAGFTRSISRTHAQQRHSTSTYGRIVRGTEHKTATVHFAL